MNKVIIMAAIFVAMFAVACGDDVDPHTRNVNATATAKAEVRASEEAFKATATAVALESRTDEEVEIAAAQFVSYLTKPDNSFRAVGMSVLARYVREDEAAYKRAFEGKRFPVQGLVVDVGRDVRLARNHESMQGYRFCQERPDDYTQEQRESCLSTATMKGLSGELKDKLEPGVWVVASCVIKGSDDFSLRDCEEEPNKLSWWHITAEEAQRGVHRERSHYVVPSLPSEQYLDVQSIAELSWSWTPEYVGRWAQLPYEGDISVRKEDSTAFNKGAIVRGLPVGAAHRLYQDGKFAWLHCQVGEYLLGNAVLSSCRLGEAVERK